jgi:hypothetical protein
MGALRINLTNGTSAFIDLSNATSVITKDHDYTKFTISLTVGGAAQDWVVDRWMTPDMSVGKDIIWEEMMKVAYHFIANNPIEFGYPDLGTDPLIYIAYDDNKFLSSAIDSALSNVAEPAVLENRTAIYGMLAENDADDVINEYQSAKANLEAELKALGDDCDAGIAGPGGTYTWPDGHVCTSVECCAEYKAKLETEGLAALLAPFIAGTKWRHQYLFVGIAETGPK